MSYVGAVSLLPDPAWPVIVLAVITFGDAIICLKPVPFIADCFNDVNFPQRYWRAVPVVKFAAAAGLIAGLWLPGLGLVTSVALVVYFIVAITMHLRARDLGRNLFANATGMLLICLAVLIFSFLV